jgi:hypothetical protein
MLGRNIPTESYPHLENTQCLPYCSSTDVIARSAGPIQLSRPSTNPSAHKPLGFDQAGVFEEFFQVCRFPNAAEVEFLARVSGLTEDEVQRWCEYRIQQCKAQSEDANMWTVNERTESVKDASFHQKVVNEGPSFLVEHLRSRGEDVELADEDMLGYEE